MAFPSALVFLTGAAALILEVVWARGLLLALGAGAPSLAVAAAGTMLGLAAGSELGGRVADRRCGGLALFGATQIGAALAALGATAALRAGAAVDLPWPLLLAVVAVPNVLLGASLPALAPALDDLRSGVGRLYAANTAGAVAGTLAAGFWLVERLGLSGSAGAGAGLCALAGAAALSAGGKARVSSSKEDAHGDPRALVGAAASGFGIMAIEVLDTRFLIHGFHATTHAFAVILACFIAGLAAGAGLCSARLRKSKSPLEDLGAVLIAGGALALLAAPALSRASADASLSWGARLTSEALVSSVLLLPGAVVLGLAFPLAAAAYVRRAAPGASTGRVFLVNTLCAAAGSLTAGFLLPPLLGLRGGLALTTLILAVPGAWLLGRRAGWAVAATLALAGVFWARPGSYLEPEHMAGHEAGWSVLCYREGALATVEVAEEDTGFKTLFIDGFVTAGESATSSYMALMGRLPLALAAGPKRALVVCLGGGATARAVAEKPDLAIDLVDVNPDVFACAPAFGSANEALLKRAGGFIEDGRRFLRREGPAYDVITQEPMPPYFAGTAALYSVEYYRLARRRLSPGGVLAQWLPLHLTAPRDARQIVAAALTVFPETWVALAPGGETAIVLSSPSPLDEGRRKTAASKLKAEFVLDPAAAARYASGVEPVTDDRPALEYSGIDRVRGAFGTPDELAAFNIAELKKAAAP